ncbi:unnamed protein product [Periconia digitata]|uniref:Uncharacterized protein n=1 Tax=Periconia digitata TaxID=1303443 RepID=A0A9W4UP07_9PLEO|nr:unnamed protein product [Periconia digitata]
MFVSPSCSFVRCFRNIKRSEPHHDWEVRTKSCLKPTNQSITMTHNTSDALGASILAIEFYGHCTFFFRFFFLLLFSSRRLWVVIFPHGPRHPDCLELRNPCLGSGVMLFSYIL